MVQQVTQLGVLQRTGTGFSGETGWKDQEWGFSQSEEINGICGAVLWGNGLVG